MIPVSKPYLPDREKLNSYIDGIYERHWLTNNGQLVQELTRRLENYLGVTNLLLVANGTLALQIAYRTLGIAKQASNENAQAITTPFTFIATASSLKWDEIDPVFVDINPNSWCIAPEKIEASLTPRTRAIVPVHVFGNSCQVDEIDAIAKRHKLKIIYDASHAFGVRYGGRSLLEHGDAATLSFHATKLFHTGEGGAIVFKRKEDLESAKKMINFGITGPENIDGLGINAKMSEFQAAMGLCVLDEIESNVNLRRRIVHQYQSKLAGLVQFQELNPCIEYNGAYVPAVFDTEEITLRVQSDLNECGVNTRRYFYPSLDSLRFFSNQSTVPISNDISRRILCLPIYSDLTSLDLDRICDSIHASLSH